MPPRRAREPTADRAGTATGEHDTLHTVRFLYKHAHTNDERFNTHALCQRCPYACHGYMRACTYICKQDGSVH